MKTGYKKSSMSHLIVPLVALGLLILFNLIRDPSFFSVAITHNNLGNPVLTGNLISVFNGASELAILAMGMTLVTAASGGQDISVGAAAAIAGSVFVSVLRSGPITVPMIIVAFVIGALVAMVCGGFNGTLVAVFKIQPMIATLILFTIGRAIAYWINGGATPTVSDARITAIGGFIPGIPVPTPIFIVILVGIIFALVLKFTNLGLYTQAVGINEKSARLVGINVVWMKLLVFIILGLCTAIAGTISVSRLGLINHETMLLNIEMDAILAVAIGGNALGGGKFSMIGSVIGAYVIQGLTITLYAMKVPSTDVKAYKAIVILIIVALGSPVAKRFFSQLGGKTFKKRQTAKGKEVVANVEK